MPAVDAPAAGWSCQGCGAENPVGAGFCGQCGIQANAPRHEELRLVTALFADLSGFTTLADTLDVESLHDVIRPLIAALAEIAERYGGTIEKYAGDAILVVYGAPVAHEDDTQRALQAALDMHAALPRLLAQLGPDASALTIHIGVNTGRVIAGAVGSEQQSDYAVLGDSVILAQRLESVCPPGQTYVGAATRALTEDEFEYAPVGALQLKGKLAAVEAFQLLGRRQRQGAAAGELVGRERELDELVAAVQSAGTGGSVLTVVGEPGAGKSRLLREARRRAKESNLRWLSARCISYGTSVPYWPIAELLRRVLRISLEDPAEQSAARVRSSVATDTVPAALRLLGLPAESLSPEQARRQVHDGVVSWLRSMTAEEPMVLEVEDVHWVDAATLDVLREVAADLGGTRLTLVLSARPGAHSVLDTISGEARRHDIDVRPLGTDALAALVEGVLGAAPAPALLDRLSGRTNGNPLFAKELARSLLDSGALRDGADGLDLKPGWDDDRLPATIERVLAARLDLLAPAAVTLLQTASVIGRVTSVPLLQAVLGSAPVEAPVAELLDAGLLEPAGAGLAFHHALLQDVVYGRLLRKHRRTLHRRVAEAGRSLYGDTDETVDLLARHLFLAEAGEEAVDPLLRAGRRAARMYANEQAVVHLERALEVLASLGDESERRIEVQLELAALHQLRGAHEQALRLYDGIRESSGRPEAWAGGMACLRALGDYPAVLDMFAVVGPALDPRDAHSAVVWMECANTLSVMGRFGDAISMLRTQIRLTAPDHAELRGQLLTQLAYAEGQLRLIDAAVQHAEEAVAILDDAATLRALAAALRVAGMAHAYAGDLAPARARLDRGMETAERIGLLVEAAGCLLNSGLVVLDTDPEDAAARFRAALDRFTRIGHPAGRVQAIGNLADALCRAGALDEADRAVDTAVALATRIGHRLTLADVTWTRAKIRQARGQALLASDAAEEAARLFLELEDVGEAAACMQLAVSAALDGGEVNRARSLSERARALSPSD